RSGRGKTSRVLDDPMTEVALRDRAREADRRRSAAFAELAAAASRLPQTRLSADALEVFCELLTLAMAAREQQTGTGSAFDPRSVRARQDLPGVGRSDDRGGTAGPGPRSGPAAERGVRRTGRGGVPPAADPVVSGRAGGVLRVAHAGDGRSGPADRHRVGVRP